LGDYTTALWLLKCGTFINLYFLVNTRRLAFGNAEAHILPLAQIFFAVSAYRCLFPVRYEHNVVFHDSILSSIFVTRLFATFSEVAYIFLLAHVLRLLNVGQVKWVTVVSWLMIAQVVISQCFVWAAVLTEQHELYYYEELGWALIFLANTVASAYLYLTVGKLGGREILVQLNLLFGALYLPWQVVHLTTLQVSGRRNTGKTRRSSRSISKQLTTGLKRAVQVKTRRTDADSWAGSSA
jgi:hypothetical protein